MTRYPSVVCQWCRVLFLARLHVFGWVVMVFDSDFISELVCVLVCEHFPRGWVTEFPAESGA